MTAVAVVALAVLSSEMKRASGQSVEPLATPAKAASIEVATPQEASPGVFLVVGVPAYTPPRRGAVEAIVTVSAGAGTGEREVGRFTVIPDEPFKEQTFRLDATAALAGLRSSAGTLRVNVRLVPLNPDFASSDAALTVGRVVFQPRQ